MSDPRVGSVTLALIVREVLMDDHMSDPSVGSVTLALIVTEVLVDDHMSDPRVGSSVVVLSQPSDMDGLHSSLSHSSLSHSYHDHHHQDDDHHATQSEQQAEYDHSQLLHPDLHHEEITTSHHHHVLAYPPLDPSSQHGHDDQTVAEEIEVGVSSSSSHPQSGGSIHMDPMMESDDEFDALDKHSS